MIFWEPDIKAHVINDRAESVHPTFCPRPYAREAIPVYHADGSEFFADVDEHGFPIATRIVESRDPLRSRQGDV